jgi:hypothetical protein
MKGREKNPNFPLAWRAMEARDKKEREELSGVILPLQERWKQEMKVRKKLNLIKNRNM